MKVLVTGSEGYIGSVLVPILQQAGHEVTGLDACYLSHRYFLGELPKYKLIRADVRDVKVSDLKGYDAICHLAALSNDPAGELIPGVTEDINYKGTVSLAKKAKQAGVKRFIFSSSCSTYGASGSAGHLDENAQFNPVTAYAISKVLSEKELTKLADREFSPVYLRNATAYGVSPRLRLDLVVNNLVAWAYTTGKIAMTSDGTPWRPLAHVKDISLAFMCALTARKETIHDQAFNIGRSDANYQIRQIAEEVGVVMKEARITFGKSAGGDPDKRSYKVSFEKASRQLAGFVPEYDLKKGIEEILVSYRQYGLKEQDLGGDKFITLNRYKALLSEGKIGKDFRWNK